MAGVPPSAPQRVLFPAVQRRGSWGGSGQDFGSVPGEGPAGRHRHEGGAALLRGLLGPGENNRGPLCSAGGG